jgi:Na+-translocating ferredoxin:NAD+ oxidoreductase RnfG subunit
MNKMIKLPLFLGVVGGLCGGLLAATNYLTHDKIVADAEKRANAALYVHFADAAKFEDATLSDTLTAASVTGKKNALTSDNNVMGSIYFCSVVGYAGKSTPIEFSVSIASGNVKKIVVTGSGESAAGAKFISWVGEASEADLNPTGSRQETWKATTGSSISTKAVATAVDACLADYQGGTK